MSDALVISSANVSVKSAASANVSVKKIDAFFDVENHAWILSEIQSLHANRGLESDTIDTSEIDQRNCEMHYPSTLSY
jgi:hypothetical protein